MVNAVHEEDSSSAKDNSFFITNICSTSSGLIKIINSEGVSFLSRLEYFPNEYLERLNEDSLLNIEQLSTLLKGVKTYSAELKALNYLGRAEHSRFQLFRKLKKKEFSDEEILPALDYLEGQKILDDARFAIAWLNTRKIGRKEGRQRLSSELSARGISFNIAKTALDIFFLENSEKEICKKALEKQQRKGLDGQKLLRTMCRLGFPFRLIKICLEEKKSN